MPETEDTLTEEMTWLQRRETREAVNPNFTDEYEMIRSQLPLLSEWVDFMDTSTIERFFIFGFLNSIHFEHPLHDY